MPHGHWKTTTFLAALRHDGMTAPCVFDGAINGECFRAPVEQALAPTLRPNDLVIMDNLGAHKVQGVRHFLRGVAALHPFWYPVALEEFRAATRIEPDFAMAYWGEAMAHNHPVWGDPQDTEAAREVLARLMCSDPSATRSPLRGTTPVLTPNPIAAGIPRRPDPLLIDISTPRSRRRRCASPIALRYPIRYPSGPLPSRKVVPRGGIEPPTRGFSVRCSTD
jgi:hypothetical protein